MKSYNFDGHKLYWHLDRLSAWQAGDLIAPIYVEVSPVSFCNHRCLFCGLDFAQVEKLRLDTAATCNALADMARLGVKSVMFAGEGEPLLHTGLADMVRSARMNGLDVSITTNGSMGNRDLWQRLVPHLSWVRFSVDAGNPETYAAVHGVKTSAFDATLESIRQALAVRNIEAGNCTIGVQFLLIDENLPDLEQAIQTFGSLGVDYLSFKPYSEHPQMLKKKGFKYSAQLIATIEALVERYRQSYGNTNIIFRKTATEAYATGSKAFDHCRALPFWGYISSNGDIYTCSVFINDRRFKIGNIRQDRMDDILFGEQRRISVTHGSKDLEISHECRVNCRMARINEFLDMLSKRPEHLNFI
jgi:cyclic pyranopterin phosphate synthase